MNHGGRGSPAHVSGHPENWGGPTNPQLTKKCHRGIRPWDIASLYVAPMQSPQKMYPNGYTRLQQPHSRGISPSIAGTAGKRTQGTCGMVEDTFTGSKTHSPGTCGMLSIHRLITIQRLQQPRRHHQQRKHNHPQETKHRRSSPQEKGIILRASASISRLTA